ncbi:phage major capsid protein [Phocaeicola paurosaccharolyticus]|uniref:phage major capsid protein n=1 Tax=Phocaeicola paurosaccharolyticus TaxID=732242 RepID=UPI000469E919|nr:phage major capsid protein [Phocaeicola paurosaccharolyticus]
MNSLELKDKRAILQKQLSDIIGKAEKEERKLNADENALFETLTKEIESISNELRNLENDNKNNNKKVKSMKFNLLSAIRSIANNQPMDEAALEINKRGVEEMRKGGLSYGGQLVLPMEYREGEDPSIHVGDLTYGKENVATDKLGLLEPLRNNLVMVKAGATMLNGLVGDVSIPTYSGSSVSWEDETATAKDGKGSFGEVKLSPKRLTAVIEISKQFLAQDSNSAEGMLKADLVRAITEKLESTILGNGAGSITTPAGLFYGVIADTTDVTYKDIVGMESTLEAANVGGNICYIISPSAKADLKTTAKATNQGFIMEGSEMNGYPVLCSSAVSAKGVVMGNFNDYVIGQFGAIDLTVDPFTKAGDGKIRLVINTFFDAKPRRAASFAKKVLKA